MRIRSANCSSWRRPLTPGASTAISSPPQRATTSEGRSPSVRRRTTSISTSSPTACPKRSFTDLKRSRSTTNSPAGTAPRTTRECSAVIASSNARRFAAPVSWSRRAFTCSAASSAAVEARLRWAISSAVRSENTVITTRKGLVPSAIRRTERIGTTSTALEEVDPQAEGPELEQEPGLALEHDQEPADAVHEDRHRHPCGRCSDHVRAVPGQQRQPDDAGDQPLERRDPTLGGLAAPDRLGLDDLGGDAGGDADERAADQRGENDDRRRCRVPAARPELDDDALRCGCCDDERDRHRQRRLERCAFDDHPERRRDDRDERDADRNAGAARRVGDAWGWTASNVLAPSPPCRSWTRHPPLIKREQRPRRYPPFRGGWLARTSSTGGFGGSSRRRRRRSGVRA